MMFRPLPILTLVTIPVLAALIALGVWQLDRAQWKAGLIADFERTSAAPPEKFDAALCSASNAEGKVVEPPAAAGKSLRMFGHDAAGDSGWRGFQAVRLSCGKTVLAETAFEQLTMGAEQGPPAMPVAATRYLVEAWPGKQWMAAENTPASNEWHWFDAPAMAQAVGASDLDARYVVTPLAGMPDHLTRTPPSGHIGYAVTWFGIAIGLIVIYALFHARAGRLRFRKQAPKQGATGK
jgi:surfeit locus 1 family protein